MQKSLKILVILSLLTISLGYLPYPLQAHAQVGQESSYSNYLALLAIAPPPENAGILDIYQLPVAPDIPKANVVLPGYPLSAAWSPDGSILALIMITGRPGGDSPPSDIDIYTVDSQGKNLVKLTDTPTCPEIGLGWQADGNGLYFTSFCRDSQATIFWSIDPHTGAAEQLGDVQWDGTWAVWSPDVSKIALLAPRRSEDGAMYDELYVVSRDGQVVVNVAKDVHPGYLLQQSTVLAWSPQGDWLAFAGRVDKTDQGDVNQIILARPDGSERKALATSQPAQECLNPLWSPDGQWISFTCGGNLFAVHSDGTELKNLTSPSAGQAVEFPAWAPDAKSLAFISLASDGKRKLESVQLDGEQRQQIAEILAVQTFGLAWNPIAQVVSQEVVSTPTSSEVSQVVSLTPAVSETGQVLSLTPESLGVQGEGLTSSDQAGSASYLPPGEQPGRANNLSYLWLLLVLIVGGGGVFFLIRRTAKLPEIVKYEDERKQRREQRKQEHAPSIQAEDHPAQPSKTAVREVEETEQPALLQRGISQVRSKDIKGGIATLHQYVDTAPGDSTAWLWLGWASALNNELRTAERCFLHARRLGNPQAEEALEWLNKSRK